MVNQSKANDLRFWKRWNDSGATNTPLGSSAKLHTVFRDDLEIYYPREWTIGEIKIDGRSVYGFGPYAPGSNHLHEVLDYILDNPRIGFTDGFVGYPIPGREGGINLSVRLGCRNIWLQPKVHLTPQEAFDRYNEAEREVQHIKQAQLKRSQSMKEGMRFPEPSTGLDSITRREFPAVVSEYDDVRSMSGQLSTPMIGIINAVYRLNREAPLDIEDPSRLKNITPKYIVDLIKNGIDRVRDSPYGKSLQGFVAAETTRLEQNRTLLNAALQR